MPRVRLLNDEQEAVALAAFRAEEGKWGGISRVARAHNISPQAMRVILKRAEAREADVSRETCKLEGVQP
jgi:hypothetical protein